MARSVSNKCLATDNTDKHRFFAWNWGEERQLEERDPQTYAIIGAAMEVRNVLGYGFLESVYHAALAVELAANSVPFRRECGVAVHYKGNALPCQFKADLICFESVIVELKALPRLSNLEEAQLVNYLKASGLRKGLLLNFGPSKLEYKRFVY